MRLLSINMRGAAGAALSAIFISAAQAQMFVPENCLNPTGAKNEIQQGIKREIEKLGSISAEASSHIDTAKKSGVLFCYEKMPGLRGAFEPLTRRLITGKPVATAHELAHAAQMAGGIPPFYMIEQLSLPQQAVLVLVMEAGANGSAAITAWQARQNGDASLWREMESNNKSMTKRFARAHNDSLNSDGTERDALLAGAGAVAHRFLQTQSRLDAYLERVLALSVINVNRGFHNSASPPVDFHDLITKAGLTSWGQSFTAAPDFADEAILLRDGRMKLALEAVEMRRRGKPANTENPFSGVDFMHAEKLYTQQPLDKKNMLSIMEKLAGVSTFTIRQNPAP